MRPYSLSKINCLKQCPMKYKLTYIDKVKQERSDALIKGSSIHEALEHVDTANKFVATFFNSDIGRKYHDIIIDADKEVRIGLDISNGVLIPCRYSNSCLYRGVIDVLNRNYIIDYKTGRYHENPDWSQLAYYAAWLFLNSDYDEIHISYLYIEHDLEKSMTLHRKILNDILRYLIQDLQMVKEYDENPVERYNTSPLCDYCGVRNHCKMNVDNLVKILDPGTP